MLPFSPELVVGVLANERRRDSTDFCIPAPSQKSIPYKLNDQDGRTYVLIHERALKISLTRNKVSVRSATGRHCYSVQYYAEHKVFPYKATGKFLQRMAIKATSFNR